MKKRRDTRWVVPLLAVAVLALASLTCGSPADQAAIQTVAAHAAQTAASEAKNIAATQAAEAIKAAGTRAAELKVTAVAALATELATKTASPWDVSWLPEDSEGVAGRIDGILVGTGLAGRGQIILDNARNSVVNPAFALAMFRKEASFANPTTRAYANNNPGNINATGGCKGLSAGSSCSGVYGEVGTDGRFGIYASMKDGIAAYFRLLSREYRPGTKRNCPDITCIIKAYCPSSECDTAAYITQITDWTTEYQSQILAP
jgi:hypothetical protein